MTDKSRAEKLMDKLLPEWRVLSTEQLVISRIEEQIQNSETGGDAGSSPSPCSDTVAGETTAPPVVKEIIKKYLVDHGYDGLAGEECGCSTEDLFMCEEGLECVPAFKCECDGCDEFDHNCFTSDPSRKCWQREDQNDTEAV